MENFNKTTPVADDGEREMQGPESDYPAFRFPEERQRTAPLSELSEYEQARITTATEITIDKANLLPDSIKNYSSCREILNDYELNPRYQLEIDGTKIGISRVFAPRHDSHLHALLFVEDDNGGYVARNFYKSGSQNSWRLLQLRNNGGHGRSYNNEHFYKSPYGEQAINAPIELQKALDEISLAEDSDTFPPPPFDIGVHVGDEKTRDCRILFESEVTERPWLGHEQATLGRRLAPPENLTLTGDNAPDFSNELLSWQDKDGNTKRVFGSVDGELKYEFLTDTSGRSCLVMAECADAGISTFGLRSEFIQTGDFTTPLYEYDSQTEGYGDLDDAKYPYEGTWRKYLSQAPFIRDYTDYLRGQGQPAAEYDDPVGQAEEVRIGNIIQKQKTGEPLSLEEIQYVFQPHEQFAYPKTADHLLRDTRERYDASALLDAGLSIEAVEASKNVNLRNFEDYLRHGVNPDWVIQHFNHPALLSYFDVFLKYAPDLSFEQLEELTDDELELIGDDLNYREAKDQPKIVAALLERGMSPDRLVDLWPEQTLQCYEALVSHGVPVDISQLVNDVHYDYINSDLLGHRELKQADIVEVAEAYSRLSEIGADPDVLAKHALETFKYIDERFGDSK